jgi:hypothetical protein
MEKKKNAQKRSKLAARNEVQNPLLEDLSMRTPDRSSRSKMFWSGNMCNVVVTAPSKSVQFHQVVKIANLHKRTDLLKS